MLVFGIWLPETFLTTYNAQIVAGDQAITAMLALGLIIPLAAGTFDLSVAATLRFSVCVVAWLQESGVNPVLGLPAERRIDKGVPWSSLPRS